MDPSEPRPVLVIHDLWLHAEAFSAWTVLLAAHGRVGVVPGWPGEQGTVDETWAAVRSGRCPDVGLLDLVDHFSAIARSLARPPVVIGHGFGGLVAEMLLGRGEAWAAVAIDPAVLRGALPFPWSQLVSLAAVLGAGSDRSRWMGLDHQQFRRLYGSGLTAGGVQTSHRRWSIPAPVGPVIDAATGAGILRTELAHPPDAPRHHLVVIGSLDRTAPAGLVRTNLSTGGPHRPAVRRVEGRGHSLAGGDGWSHVAHTVLGWLDAIDPPRHHVLPSAPSTPEESHHEVVPITAAAHARSAAGDHRIAGREPRRHPGDQQRGGSADREPARLR